MKSIYPEPSDALLIVIMESMIAVTRGKTRTIHRSDIQRALNELGYENFKCSYIGDRYRDMSKRKVYLCKV
jgi:hypothetical protein